ncbi:MAG: TetR/AcrR family transcriptional regulator [Sphingomonadales bacterium]|nr:TetR/AcrR family transcriptional regulator [Sphingomonadales bacterium]MBD3772204.1 TetR/AcrR family transcriptional regulator [Paracoccaceae bacterium]
MAPKIVDRDARRRAILDAAATTFAQRGYRNTTMDEIAAAAGLAKGTLYLSYKSKEELFFALFEDFADEAAMPDTALPPGADPLETVTAVLCGIAARLDADSVIVPLTLEFWSASGVEATGARFGDRYRAMLDMFAGQMVALLRQGQADGTLAAELPLESLAANLLALIDGLIVQRWVDPAMSIEARLRDALPHLLAGLRAR